MSTAIPLLFTLPPSNRHEIILVERTSLKQLNRQIVSIIGTSPNCAEFMSKYKASAEADAAQISELKIHWADASRDRKVWPEYTIVTEENWPAVFELLRVGVGRDVLEVRIADGKE